MKPASIVREVLERGGETKSLPKKHTLLEQGEVSRHAYYVESGCLRLWHNDYGTDLSVKFFLPGDLVASFESFYLQERSAFGLETILPSVVKVAGRGLFADHMDQSPAFKDEILATAVACMSDYQKLFLNQIMKNPEDRLRLLTAEDSRLLEVVPQHYIASYLGITPVSLSRIRKKLQAR
ncbi:MAG: Crp/Fnr family transcriptional regulator [Pseudomonadota bacterium]